jgi:putative PIN family toxin of toxin-antitoxin system
MRVVADTNTVVSGLFWHGPPRQLLDAARAGIITLVTSAPLLNELARVLARPKFAQRIDRAGLSVEEIVDTYGTLAEQVTPADIPPTVTADPDDDAVLATAVGGQADLIVSGDADLLGLGSFREIRIIHAADAVVIPPRE